MSHLTRPRWDDSEANEIDGYTFTTNAVRSTLTSETLLVNKSWVWQTPSLLRAVATVGAAARLPAASSK